MPPPLPFIVLGCPSDPLTSNLLCWSYKGVALWSLSRSPAPARIESQCDSLVFNSGTLVQFSNSSSGCTLLISNSLPENGLKLHSRLYRHLSSSEAFVSYAAPFHHIEHQGRYKVHSWSVTVFVAAVRQLQLEIRDGGARKIGRKKSTQKLIAKRILGTFSSSVALKLD